MKFLEETNVTQPPDEPPRRFFTDGKHFDLYIWYSELKKISIVGFQLSFRSNPFNTDCEYYISHFPSDIRDDQNHLGKTDLVIAPYAAPKIIKTTDAPPSAEMLVLLNERLDSLPPDVRAYVESQLKKAQ